MFWKVTNRLFILQFPKVRKNSKKNIVGKLWTLCWNTGDGETQRLLIHIRFCAKTKIFLFSKENWESEALKNIKISDMP